MRGKVTQHSHRVTPKCVAHRIVVVQRSHRVSPKGNGKGVVLRKARDTRLVRVSTREGVIVRQKKDRFILKIDT